LVPGLSLDAELAFFPGSYPLRALVKSRNGAPASLSGLPGYPDLTALLASYADALAHNPWLERFPAPLQAVVPVRRGDRWSLRDTYDRSLPLSRSFSKEWSLLAMIGGHPISLFA